MIQKVCQNPDCNNLYTVVEEDSDGSMGCCSFSCWEKIYCLEPEHINFERIELVS